MSKSLPLRKFMFALKLIFDRNNLESYNYHLLNTDYSVEALIYTLCILPHKMSPVTNLVR